MQLRHLHYFVRIVEAGSFSRAARTIHVAQPALSQQIAELEEKVGVTLLHRSARGVRPTAAGEAMYREATAILRQVENLPGIVRSAGGEIEGIVSLGVSSTLASYLAGRLMEACRAALPRVKLRLVSGDSMLLKSRIGAGMLDFALVFEDEPTPGFVRQPLFRQSFFLIRREPLPGGATSVSIEELAMRPLILPSQPNVTRGLLDRVFAAANLVPAMVAEADVLSSMLSAVQAGLGDTVVPKGDFSDVPGHGALLPIRIDPPIHLTACVVSSADMPLTQAAETLRGLVRDFVAQQVRETAPPGTEWIGDEQP